MKADEADDGLILFFGPMRETTRAVRRLLSVRVPRRIHGHVPRHGRHLMVGCSHYWERVLVQLQLLYPVPEKVSVERGLRAGYAGLQRSCR
jgi:hypothetical protein